MRWIMTLACAVVVLPGCAVSRHQEVKALSRRVEGRLKQEQAVALAGSPATPQLRQQKLEHLSGLRLTLSAANVALGTVPRMVPEPQRPVAYDVLEEVYATIDWNIPLLPGEGLRGMPAGFDGGVLNLGAVGGGGMTGGVVP